MIVRDIFFQALTGHDRMKRRADRWVNTLTNHFALKASVALNRRPLLGATKSRLNVANEDAKRSPLA